MGILLPGGKKRASLAIQVPVKACQNAPRKISIRRCDVGYQKSGWDGSVEPFALLGQRPSREVGVGREMKDDPCTKQQEASMKPHNLCTGRKYCLRRGYGRPRLFDIKTNEEIDYGRLTTQSTERDGAVVNTIAFTDVAGKIVVDNDIINPGCLEGDGFNFMPLIGCYKSVLR